MAACACGCGMETKNRFAHGHNRRGTQRSPETLEKMRSTWAEKKDEWRKSLKESANRPEFKEAISRAHKGRKLPEEQRKNIGRGNKGKVRTEEMKELYRQRNLGKRMGEENNLWKGGISRSYKTGYYSPEYQHWRREVFKRDGYRCQKCGSGDGKYVTAHHIKSFAYYPELRYELTNGITLCEACHCEVDNYRARFKPLNNLKTK